MISRLVNFKQWPPKVGKSDFSVYKKRRMAFLDYWTTEEWAIKAYGIQHEPVVGDGQILRPELVTAAQDHVLRMLPATLEEGQFYKTGFAVLHEGKMANWLLFQWWAHQDVWCQLLSYASRSEPLKFMTSTRPVRACVYETAIIWYEQQSWIKHALNGAPNRLAYLEDVMRDRRC